ncbi:unnamed protein product [Rhizophagus irregularis]|nr:unnamed protein product [Rhizophagus irregularis]
MKVPNWNSLSQSLPVANESAESNSPPQASPVANKSDELNVPPVANENNELDSPPQALPIANKSADNESTKLNSSIQTPPGSSTGKNEDVDESDHDDKTIMKEEKLNSAQMLLV